MSKDLVYWRFLVTLRRAVNVLTGVMRTEAVLELFQEWSEKVKTTKIISHEGSCMLFWWNKVRCNNTVLKIIIREEDDVDVGESCMTKGQNPWKTSVWEPSRQTPKLGLTHWLIVKDYMSKCFAICMKICDNSLLLLLFLLTLYSRTMSIFSNDS